MFQSRSIAMHLLRGIAGFGFLFVVLSYGPALGWWALAPAVAALVCLRGCPMCWMFGLIETVLSRKQDTACVDGSCTRPSLNNRLHRGAA